MTVILRAMTMILVIGTMGGCVRYCTPNRCITQIGPDGLFYYGEDIRR